MNSQVVVKRNLFGHYSIAYACPLCHTALRSKLSEAGQKDICPECQKSFTVPSPRDKDTAEMKAKEIEPRVKLETEEEIWRKEQEALLELERKQQERWEEQERQFRLSQKKRREEESQPRQKKEGEAQSRQKKEGQVSWNKGLQDLRDARVKEKTEEETEEEIWRREQMWYLHRESEKRKLEQEARLELEGKSQEPWKKQVRQFRLSQKKRREEEAQSRPKKVGQVSWNEGLQNLRDARVKEKKVKRAHVPSQSIHRQQGASNNKQGNEVGGVAWWGCVIMAILVIGGWIGTDEDSSNVPTTATGIPITNEGIALQMEGQRRLRAQLRDPDSLEIITERIVRPGRNGGVVGYQATYRARNGFGGMTVDTFYTE